MPFTIDFRPIDFNEIHGNLSAVKALRTVYEARQSDWPHAVLLSGPSGCLNGDTVIFDPVDESNMTVKERWERAQPFNVFAFSPFSEKLVIAGALPPVQYPEAQMFHVETDESSFCVTGGHQFRLADGGYLSLQVLFERQVSSIPLLSISESCLKVQHQDGYRCQKRGRDYQESCSHDSRLCDELPPAASLVCQESLPLQDDVRGYILRNSLLGDGGDEQEHNRFCLQSALLSMRDFLIPEILFSRLLMYSSFLGSEELSFCQPRTFRQAQVGSSLLNRVEKFFGHLRGGIFSDRKILSLDFLDKFLLALHRPPSFSKDIVSGRTIIKKIRRGVKEKYYDFHVPVYNNYWAGGLIHHNCGKTTIGRIIAAKVGCTPEGLQEINSANNRGIDTARAITSEVRYKPMGSPVRVYILDECFAKGTLIKTAEGDKEIQDIRQGDFVYGMGGLAQVRKTFVNQVELDRIAKVRLIDGREIVCSTDHLFFTDWGWVKAKDLKRKNLILKFNRSLMDNKKLREDFDHGEDLRVLPEQISAEEINRPILFLSVQGQGDNQDIGNSMRMVRTGFQNEKEGNIYEEILFNLMRGQMEYLPAGNEGSFEGRRAERGESSKALDGGESRICGKDQADLCCSFRSDEGKQSIVPSRNRGENNRDQETEWDSEYLERRKGRQWEIDLAANFACGFFGMGCGDSDFFGAACSRLSDLLQSGCRELDTEDRSGGGRQWAQLEGTERKRFEEDPQARGIGVESIEVYERGNNDGSFQGVIDNKERDQGFALFYDLEMIGHPSYYVNGVLVHNCHQTSSDFQNAMLKVLEDAPAHAYFILCTTDPQKIIPTVRNRCMQFEVQSLNDKELIGLMADVLGRLDIQGFPQDALREIAVVADGCPRQALMILDKVVDMEDSEMMSAIEQMRYGADKGVPDLCRALLAGKKWPEIVKILKQMDLSNNALEGVRLGVMGHMANVLLGAKGMSPEAVTAALVIDYFEKPWYNMGRAGLVKACFGAVVGDK